MLNIFQISVGLSSFQEMFESSSHFSHTWKDLVIYCLLNSFFDNLVLWLLLLPASSYLPPTVINTPKSLSCLFIVWPSEFNQGLGLSLVGSPRPLICFYWIASFLAIEMLAAYILWIWSPYQKCVLQIFSHLLGCVLTFVSSAVQKLPSC